MSLWGTSILASSENHRSVGNPVTSDSESDKSDSGSLSESESSGELR